jgi:hypothetical protein
VVGETSCEQDWKLKICGRACTEATLEARAQDHRNSLASSRGPYDWYLANFHFDLQQAPGDHRSLTLTLPTLFSSHGLAFPSSRLGSPPSQTQPHPLPTLLPLFL